VLLQTVRSHRMPISVGRISQVRKTQHTSPLGTMSVPATSCFQARSQATPTPQATHTQSHLAICLHLWPSLV